MHFNALDNKQVDGSPDTKEHPSLVDTKYINSVLGIIHGWDENATGIILPATLLSKPNKAVTNNNAIATISISYSTILRRDYGILQLSRHESSAMYCQYSFLTKRLIKLQVYSKKIAT